MASGASAADKGRAAAGPRSRGAWSVRLRSYRRSKLGVIGLALLAATVLAAVIAPLVSPFSPTRVTLGSRLAPPLSNAPDGRIHFLGTDHLGRDILTRILYGARISVSVSTAAVVLAGCIGITVGVVAGFRGGVIDSLLMRLVDLQLAFPFILLALAIVAVLGPSYGNIILVFVVTGWPLYARIARSAVLVIRSSEYVEAARGLGASSGRIIRRHILPNIMASMLVISSFEMARVIIAEAALGFLGVGVPPGIPTWGTMLADGRAYIRDSWWLPLFPGLAITLLAAGVSFVGDALRDALDPKLRRSQP